jgi:hypothetical protein
MLYVTQQNVDLLPWPAVSPDLSPIEHVWDEMELPNQPVTLAVIITYINSKQF